jgi:hypothetical protein
MLRNRAKLTCVFILLTEVMCLSTQSQIIDLEKVIELDQLGLYEMGAVSELGEKIYSDRDWVLESGMMMEALQQGSKSVVVQQGNENSAFLTQQGDENLVGVLQNGDKNQYNGSLKGEDNLIRVLQLGNANKVFQDLEGTGMRLDVIQEGNNHEIFQVEKDGSMPAYQIHQEGTSGMRIIVEHENVFH